MVEQRLAVVMEVMFDRGCLDRRERDLVAFHFGEVPEERVLAIGCTDELGCTDAQGCTVANSSEEYSKPPTFWGFGTAGTREAKSAHHKNWIPIPMASKWMGCRTDHLCKRGSRRCSQSHDNGQSS